MARIVIIFFILRSCMDTKAKVTQYQIYVVDIVTKFYNNDKNWQIAATIRHIECNCSLYKSCNIKLYRLYFNNLIKSLNHLM